jgi:chlorite dismutase
VSTGTTSESQRASIDAATRSHDKLELAERALHAALGRPQPTRERAWAQRVATELRAAIEAIEAHRREVEGEHGLYGELRFDAPWLLPRLHQLSAQLARIETEARDLTDEVQRVIDGDLQGLSAIRADAERMLLSLRDLRAKESDLIFERFNEPVALD